MANGYMGNPPALMQPQQMTPVDQQQQQQGQMMDPRQALWAGTLMDIGNFIGSAGFQPMQGLGPRMMMQANAWNQSLKPEPAAEQFVQLTPDQETAMGLPPEGAYQRSTTTGKVSRIGGAGTTVNINEPEAPMPSIWESSEALKLTESRRADAESARVTMNASGRALELLASEDAPFAGLTSDVGILGARVLEALGAGDTEMVRRLQASNEYEAVTGTLVGQVIKQFGSGTGLSDADREYAQLLAGALLSRDPIALRNILTTHYSNASERIDRYNQLVGSEALGGQFKGVSSMFPSIEKPDFDWGSPQDDTADNRDITQYSEEELEEIARGNYP